jgi:hypothetical protein
LNEQTRELSIPPQPERRKSYWYLLTGLLVGIIIGLAFAWLIYPVVYENTSPASLSEAYQTIYRSMVARVYAETGELNRAVSRLDLLQDENIVYTLGAQAQRALTDNRLDDAHNLALLASAIQSDHSSEESGSPLTSPSEISEETVIPTQTLPPLTPKP